MAIVPLFNSSLSFSRTGIIVLAELEVLTSSFSLMGVAVFAVILALTLASASGLGVQAFADIVLSTSSSRIRLMAWTDMAKVTVVKILVC